MKIYRYQKASDAYTVYRAQGEDINELCTLDGYTYISGPDALPDQPAQITVEETTLTDELREAIKTASPQCRLIYRRMQEKIREKYCAEDEMYFTRIAMGQLMGVYEMQPGEPEAVSEYQAFIEGVRQWGKDQRSVYGL